MKTYDVDEKYISVLQRGNFEFNRAISNVAFLLNAHAMDQNAEFLNSELFRRVEQTAFDKKQQQKDFWLGVAVLITGNENVRNYNYSQDLTTVSVKE